MPETHVGPLRQCLYCEKTHYAWKADYKCQDRYERRFDEQEELEADAKVREIEIRNLVYLVMADHDFIDPREIEDLL